MSQPRRIVVIALLIALARTLAPTPVHGFETATPAEIHAAKPGKVLRVWPLEGGVQPGYKGYRILYRSTGLNDEAVAVSGAILFPADTAGMHRPVVAWAHPTTGVKTQCAPTLNANLASTVAGIDFFTDAGYVIAATDYMGLGAPGVHPYLIGKVAAYSVLDSIRAARDIPDAHAGAKAVVWGHSQGGHAALFTAADAARYAPDIELLGAAAAAPATDLIALFDADRKTESGRSLTAMALYSWSRVFNFPVLDFINKGTEPALDRLAGDCIETIEGLVDESEDQSALGRDFLRRDPTVEPRTRTIMGQNSTGPVPQSVPVFIAQGTADDLVRPPITRTYAKSLCDAGVKVKMHMMPGGSHMTAGFSSAYAAYEWIDARFKGHAAPSDCE